MITIKNFEDRIDPKIVDRGFGYYESDSIENIDQVDKREFSASVYGSEEYTVYIKLSNGLEVKDHSCDCPYDWGNYCKHEVAVLYYIKDSKLYNEPIEKGVFYKMKTDLSKLTKEEIVEIVFDMSKRNKVVKEELMWHLKYEPND